MILLLIGQALSKPLKLGEDTKYEIEMDHARAIDDGFVGDKSTSVKIKDLTTGRKARVYPNSKPVSGITRTQTIVKWNPENEFWEVIQHYPAAKNWNQATQSYEE